MDRHVLRNRSPRNHRGSKYSARIFSLSLGIAIVICPSPRTALFGQTAEDTTAVVATALDYIEGFYEGDADRMRRALHPQLAKRAVFSDRNGRGSELRSLTARQLIEITRQGGGSEVPIESRVSKVRILDLYGNAASVRIDALEWIDYLHIVRYDGEWKIINVLWELHPRGVGTL